MQQALEKMKTFRCSGAASGQELASWAENTNVPVYITMGITWSLSCWLMKKVDNESSYRDAELKFVDKGKEDLSFFILDHFLITVFVITGRMINQGYLKSNHSAFRVYQSP